jgi:DNA excision repair protein ERCC-2
MVRWADVVIGDYNYYFDLNALLAGLTQANQWRVSLLIDEAHNLLERARGMYSADLSLKTFSLARRQAPASARRTFTTLARHWKKLDQSTSFKILQEDFLPALQNLISALSDAAVDTPPESAPALTLKTTQKPAREPALEPALEPDVLRCFFDAAHFARIAELFDQRQFSARIVADEDSPQQLTLRNIIPAGLLKPRFALAHSVVLFSATLTPWSFYADTLGLPEDSVWVDVDSPFRAEQLQVQVVDSISTRWQHRETSLSALVDVMAQQFHKRRGNYLGFFSSYDYLRRAGELLRARHPDIPVREQASGMREREQQDFLAAFTHTSEAIGLAVLGGAFSEGVDLPGNRLIGAFIATLGLPQWSAANEEIKACMASNYGAEHAYDYAYLFPGLRKVVQAAGRVIRTTSDTGTVFLLDDRFSRPEVRKLLPKWWEVVTD